MLVKHISRKCSKAGYHLESVRNWRAKTNYYKNGQSANGAVEAWQVGNSDFAMYSTVYKLVSIYLAVYKLGLCTRTKLPVDILPIEDAIVFQTLRLETGLRFKPCRSVREESS